MMGWYGGGAWGWGGWLSMSLVMLAFWGLVIWALVAVFRGTGDDERGGTGTAPRDPTEILDERFARGEIDAEEYQARQGVLRASAHDRRTMPGRAR